MTPTSIRYLITLAVVCAVASWLLLLRTYSSLPPLPWTLVLTLLLIALIEARVGYLIKARISGKRGPAGEELPTRWGRPRPLHPIAIARAAAIGKASALAAAVVGGIAAGFVIDLIRSLGQPIPRQDTFTALGILACSVLLATAAVYLERSCQVPPSEELDRHEP